MMKQYPFNIGDHRLNLRANQILEDLSKNPNQSFPKIFHQYKDLEAFYRFLNNKHVSQNDIMEPVLAETFNQCNTLKTEIIVAHDTTQIHPRSNADNVKGFGKTHGRYSGVGFFAHVSIAVTPGIRHILGPMAIQTWSRGKEKKKEESERWWQNIEEVEQKHQQAGYLIHVTDREGDSYELFSKLVENSYRFVIRQCKDRLVESAQGRKFFEVIDKAPCFATRQVLLSSRGVRMFQASKEKVHPSRDEREAELKICAMPIILKRSEKHKKPHCPAVLNVNVVHVFEPNPPQGKIPVQWYLITSEPIETVADVEKIVDTYRARWSIEEFFKALKSGCNLESRLLDNSQAWLNLLALFIPIAVTLYNLKTQAQLPQDQQNKNILNKNQWELLKSVANSQGRKVEKLSDALQEIAHLGGHIKYSGPPGWIVLSRGYQELLIMEKGYLFAMHSNM